MDALETGAHFELLIVRNFLDAETCEKIVAEMRSSRGELATVYRSDSSGSVDESARRATRIEPSRETKEFVVRRLLGRKRSVEEHFRVSLKGCEEPQFLRYGVGDFFVAHQDGNTGMLRLDREESRKVSVTILLSRQSKSPASDSYCGGSLIFHEWRPQHARGSFAFGGDAGTLVAFRPETTHEVTPVTHGERFSIACWYT
ncbi:MAG TPA: 2OG-Fe(II) oxygenase [Pyrinomonadaceae bacterium]|nr:2OG-Fe(II) oxygenase [Pyrinomonadaceae bacterium]